MPSLYEWFWRPIIEAQACWCPVISTKCWALEEVCWKWAILISNPIDEIEYINKIKDIEDKKNNLIELWLDNAKKYSSKLNSIKFIKLINEVKNIY